VLGRCTIATTRSATSKTRSSSLVRLIIKSSNLSNALAAGIKSIARRPADPERRFLWNSVAAYVLFAARSSVGLKLWSDVRIDELASEKREQTRQLQRLRRDLAEEARRAEKGEVFSTQLSATASTKSDQLLVLIRLVVVEGHIPSSATAARASRALATMECCFVTTPTSAIAAPHPGAGKARSTLRNRQSRS
jgi:hypothetical protein